jgi:hypothetical protein
MQYTVILSFVIEIYIYILFLSTDGTKVKQSCQI